MTQISDRPIVDKLLNSVRQTHFDALGPMSLETHVVTASFSFPNISYDAKCVIPPRFRPFERPLWTGGFGEFGVQNRARES